MERALHESSHIERNYQLEELKEVVDRKLKELPDNLKETGEKVKRGLDEFFEHKERMSGGIAKAFYTYGTSGKDGNVDQGRLQRRRDEASSFTNFLQNNWRKNQGLHDISFGLKEDSIQTQEECAVFLYALGITDSPTLDLRKWIEENTKNVGEARKSNVLMDNHGNHAIRFTEPTYKIISLPNYINVMAHPKSDLHPGIFKDIDVSFSLDENNIVDGVYIDVRDNWRDGHQTVAEQVYRNYSRLLDAAPESVTSLTE